MTDMLDPFSPTASRAARAHRAGPRPPAVPCRPVQIEPLDRFPDVALVIPDRHGDERGFFVETFRAQWFPGLSFVQDNHSFSLAPFTVRGLHFQSPPHAQTKLIRVSRGRIRDAVVDLRVGSPTYAEHAVIELRADDGHQLLVPVGFAHGFISLEPDTDVTYKVTDYHSPNHDGGVRWDDPELAIDWGVNENQVKISTRDRALPSFAHLSSPFTYGGGA